MFEFYSWGVRVGGFYLVWLDLMTRRVGLELSFAWRDGTRRGVSLGF